MLLAIAAAIFVFSIASAADDAVSELISLHEYDDTSTFSKNLDAIQLTAHYNWLTGSGEEPTRITDRNLGNYLLEHDAGDADSVLFVSEPSAALDVYDRNNIYFVLKVDFDDAAEGRKYKIDITLGAEDESLSFSKEVSGEKYELVSLYIGTWKHRKAIDRIEIRFSSSDMTAAYMSGPYTMGAKIKSNDRFMTSSLSLGSSEPEYIDKGTVSEAIRLPLDGGRVVLSAVPALLYSNETYNAVRVIMTNASDYETAQFRFNKLNTQTGHTETKSEEIKLIPSAERFSYIVCTGNVEDIINFSIIFDGTRTGEAIIYSIEPVYIYEGYSGNSFAVITECKKSAKHATINLVGDVEHSFFTSHDSFTLECYMLKSNETVSDVILRGDGPIAKSSISSHFIFELKLSDLGTYAMTSKYAVIAASEDGERIELCAPTSVSADLGSPKTDQNRANIKGVVSSSVSLVSNSGAGYTIIDVFLDKLTNASHSGHIYIIENSFFYFNADYVSELDKKIKSLYASGSEVYLRLLVSSDADTELISYISADGADDDTKYLAVDIKDHEAEKSFFAVTDFICKRYSENTNGRISGLILGKCVDLDRKYNYSDAASISEYAKTLATSFEFMARCAASSIDKIKVFLPISDSRSGSVGYDTELLLSSVCRYFDACGELEFSLMLEGTHTPYAIDSKTFELEPVCVDEDGNISLQELAVLPELEKAGESSDCYRTDNLYIFERLMDYLGYLSPSAPSAYIYFWKPNISAVGTGLSAAYIYNYYSIMFSDKAGAFIVDICGESSRDEENGISALANIIKYIDTDKNSSGEIYTALADIFDDEYIKSSFEECGFEMPIHRAFYEVDALNSLPSDRDFKGEFTLWDFSTVFGSLGWFDGSGCETVAISDSQKYGRTLRALMSPSLRGGSGEYSELVYYFEYPEDISFAPYLLFELAVEGDAETDCEIVIFIFDGKITAESSMLVSSGSLRNIVVDASAGGKISQLRSIRICVRPSSDDGGDLELHLKKVSANSTLYEDEALEKEFESARAKARNSSLDAGDDSSPRYEAILLIGTVLFLSILIVAFYDRNRNKGSK